MAAFRNRQLSGKISGIVGLAEGVRDMNTSKTLCSLVVLLVGLGMTGGDLEAAKGGRISTWISKFAKGVDDNLSGLGAGTRIGLKQAHDQCVMNGIAERPETEWQEVILQCADQVCSRGITGLPGEDLNPLVRECVADMEANEYEAADENEIQAEAQAEDEESFPYWLIALVGLASVIALSVLAGVTRRRA